MSTALVTVDDLGFQPMTRAEANLFFRMVSACRGRGC
jgi:DNA replication protein DnaC